MGLMKILARRSGKSTPEPPSYEFELPVGLPYQNTKDGHSPNLDTSIPPRLLRPQLSLISMTSKASLEPPFRPETATPEPSLFRHRNFGSTGRPGTAASNDSAYFDHLKGPQRPKREPRRPPVSFRKPSSTASLSVSYQNLSIEDQGSEIGSFVGIQRGRSGSITSVGSGRFKDLLDAQEEIRSIDIRTRIEATGAKDYGEDVADRNMRQNGAGHRDSISRSAIQWTNNSGQDISSQSVQPGSSGFGTRTHSLNLPGHHPQQNSPYLIKSGLDSPIPDTASIKEPINAKNVPRPNTNRLSLNTYTPSGLTSLNMPRFTTICDDVGSFVAPSWGSDSTLRPQRVSPTGSDSSVPRSLRIGAGFRIASESSRMNLANHNEKSLDKERIEESSTPGISGWPPSFGPKIANFSLPKAAAPRLSNATNRFSFASSITSRHTSGDYTGLNYPRKLNHETDGFSDSDCGYSQKTTSLHSRRQSQTKSGDESVGHISTTNSGLRPGPPAFKGSSHKEERGSPSRSGGGHEWEPPTPSNAGSASSVSNPSYSGSSGRPQSRHTKATSVDSGNTPLSTRRSEESCRSTTFGQYGSSPTWSPATANFNIDDYISSDEESFTTKRRPRRPTAQGEEDLLFKSGYGNTGEALPGLLEVFDDDSCPPPIVRETRTISMDSSLSEDEEDLGAAEPADIEDDRVSVDRDLPMTFLRHSRNIFEYEKSTFGRRPKSWRPAVKKMTSLANTEASRMSEESEYYTPPTSANEISMSDEEPSPRRELQRLSAFGTLHGRNLTTTDAIGGNVANANKDDLFLLDKERNEVVPEKIDLSSAVRLRKAVKAQKRAEEAKNIRARRMTRAFGNLEEEIAALIWIQNQDDTEESDRDQTPRPEEFERTAGLTIE